MLIDAGCDLYEPGNLFFNSLVQKYVTSNVIGAAASYDRAEIINFVMGKTNHKSMIEFKAIVTGGNPNDPLHQDYTPLQIALTSPTTNIATLKALCEHGADIKVCERDG